MSDQVFKKCPNPDCGVEHLTDSDKCSRCNSVYGVIDKSNNGIIVATSSEPKESEFSEPHCTKAY